MSLETSPAKSPFLFILNQLEAAEKAAQEALAEPPKRPRGRPPKVEEPPVPEGAIRHILSDEDSEEDKRILKLEQKLESITRAPPAVTRSVPARTSNGKLAVILPHAGRYICLIDGEVFGASKHPDYWEHHYTKGDLRRAASYSISKFVRADLLGVVAEVRSADTLAAGSKALLVEELDAGELSQVKKAITALKLGPVPRIPKG